ncbi:MAG: flagellar hook assembly protein FlgD [Puniceicoccaceae bacterium]
MDTGTINSFQQSAATQALSNEQGVVESRQNELGMDDFFKLLTTQLVSQDPLEPLADTEFIAQMANFSSLSQMESIAENMASVNRQQEAQAVMSLIGREVTADTGNGTTLTGTVTQVKMVDEDYVPYIGDTMVPYKTIFEVREKPFVETQLPSGGEESAAP